MVGKKPSESEPPLNRNHQLIKQMVTREATCGGGKAEKAWRLEAPPEDGWYLPKDIYEAVPTIQSSQTDTVRKRLEKTGVIEVKKLKVKGRVNTAIRLWRGRKYRNFLAYIYENPSLKKFYWQKARKRPYFTSVKKEHDQIMREWANLTGAADNETAEALAFHASELFVNHLRNNFGVVMEGLSTIMSRAGISLTAHADLFLLTIGLGEALKNPTDKEHWVWASKLVGTASKNIADEQRKLFNLTNIEPEVKAKKALKSG